VDAPVLGATTEFRGLFDQDDGRVRLLEEDEVEDQGGTTHNGGQVLCPAPAEVALNDEASDKGGEKRTSEDGHAEEGDGDTTGLVVKHVGEDGGDDGERAGTEETREEAADENGLNVLAGSTAGGEDGETKHGQNQG